MKQTDFLKVKLFLSLSRFELFVLIPYSDVDIVFKIFLSNINILMNSFHWLNYKNLTKQLFRYKRR